MDNSELLISIQTIFGIIYIIVYGIALIITIVFAFYKEYNETENNNNNNLNNNNGINSNHNESNSNHKNNNNNRLWSQADGNTDDTTRYMRAIGDFKTKIIEKNDDNFENYLSMINDDNDEMKNENRKENNNFKKYLSRLTQKHESKNDDDSTSTRSRNEAKKTKICVTRGASSHEMHILIAHKDMDYIEHFMYDKRTKIETPKAKIYEKINVCLNFEHLSNNVLYAFGYDGDNYHMPQGIFYNIMNDEWYNHHYLPFSFYQNDNMPHEYIPSVVSNENAILLFICYPHPDMCSMYWYDKSVTNGQWYSLDNITKQLLINQTKKFVDWKEKAKERDNFTKCKYNFRFNKDNTILIYKYLKEWEQKEEVWAIYQCDLTFKNVKHTNGENHTHDNVNSSTNNDTTNSSFSLKSVFKRIWKYKSIYLSSIIHFSDVITDYLITIQYLIYSLNYKNYNSIDYRFVTLFSFLIILFNKLLSSYYILIFTNLTRSWMCV